MIGANAEAIKSIFDELLKEELRGSHYQVEASYVMARAPFVMEFAVRGKSVRMRINLRIFRELQRVCGMPQVWMAYYQVFYIANYMKALGAARCKVVLGESESDAGQQDAAKCEVADAGVQEALPVNMEGVATYAEGLARMEAYLYGESGEKRKAFSLLLSELGKRRIRSLGVLEILSETNALIRSKALLYERLTAEQRQWIEGLVEERMLYLGLPEVVYGRNGRRRAAVRKLLIDLQDMAESRKALTERKSVKDGERIREILKRAGDGEGKEFWLELLMRLCACSPGVYAALTDEGMRDEICDRAEAYGKKAAEFHDNLTGHGLLWDDFLVIQKLGQRALSRPREKEGNIREGRIHTAY